jgi:hypothetical protein
MTADRWKCEFIMSSYVGAACDSTIRGTRNGAWCYGDVSGLMK